MSIENIIREFCRGRIVRGIALTVFLLVSLAPSLSRAEFFTWTDSSGKAWYVDSLDKVPPEYRDQAKKPRQSNGEISVGNAARKDEQTDVSPGPHADNSAKGESWWRNNVEGLRASIKRSQEDLDYFVGLQNDCAESQKNIISTRNRDCGNLWSENIRRVKKDLDRLKKKLEIDLPEEARKAGVPPGWLRETNDTAAQKQAAASKNNEAWWRNRVAVLRAELSKWQGDLDQYNEQERECEEKQKYNTGCQKKNCKVMYESQKKNAGNKVNKLKQELEVDLPEEARRAGADPGWLRE